MKLPAASGDQAEVSATAVVATRQEVGFDLDAAYRDHARFLGRVIQRMLNDGPDVDDVLQETFITAHRKRRDFAGRSSLRTWLYSIAVHLCLRRQRGLRRFAMFRRRLDQEVRPPGPGQPDQLIEQDQSRALVRKVIEGLPFKQREVLILYELERLEGSEIAELVEVPLGTVWTRLHQGRKRFAEAMRAEREKGEHP